MTDKKKILVVDDEETLCEALRFNLEEAGYEADVALSAEEALTMNISDYSLIILDIMMGEISGLQLASILKGKDSTKYIPIIFCTAKDSEDDMIKGLELGADDYISKPYSIRNVITRVKTVLRRMENVPHPHSDTISYKGLTIIPHQKICRIEGNEIKMPRKEFEILSLLMNHPGRIYTREELLKSIWPDEVVVVDRVIDVNITRLRSKLGEYGRNIVTRPGYGYGFIE